MSKGNKAQEMTDFDSSDMKNDLSVKELSSTPLTNRKIFHLASAIFIIITIFFIIYFSILLIVKPFESISLNYYALLNIEDLIEYQFVNWGSARMGFDLATFYSISFTGGSPTGYIIAALLIVTGVLCLISIDKIKSRGKGLLQAAVILNMLNGLFLVISTILSNIAYENIYLEDITEGSASLLNAAFRLEITFVVVIIISIILILIYAPFSKQVASLIPNLVSMGIGFIIFIVSSIFALNAMQLFFEYMLGIGGTPDIEQILVKLLPTTILAFLGYLFIIASFLFGMNKLHSKKAPKAYTTSFEIVTSLYLVSFFVEHLLTHLFGFLYPIDIVDYDVLLELIIKRTDILNIFSTLNEILFWILLLLGMFSVANAILSTGIQPITSHEEIYEKEVKPVVVVLCPICGETIREDSKECKKCGAKIETRKPAK